MLKILQRFAVDVEAMENLEKEKKATNSFVKNVDIAIISISMQETILQKEQLKFLKITSPDARELRGS